MRAEETSAIGGGEKAHPANLPTSFQPLQLSTAVWYHVRSHTLLLPLSVSSESSSLRTGGGRLRRSSSSFCVARRCLGRLVWSVGVGADVWKGGAECVANWEI